MRRRPGRLVELQAPHLLAGVVGDRQHELRIGRQVLPHVYVNTAPNGGLASLQLPDSGARPAQPAGARPDGLNEVRVTQREQPRFFGQRLPASPRAAAL